MSRQARVVVPNVPLHITQRGNRKENIFLDDEINGDSLKLKRLFEYLYLLGFHSFFCA